MNDLQIHYVMRCLLAYKGALNYIQRASRVREAYMQRIREVCTYPNPAFLFLRIGKRQNCTEGHYHAVLETKGTDYSKINLKSN